jgi:hypothetical protein
MLVAGIWPLASGPLFLVASYWLQVAGFWPLFF